MAVQSTDLLMIERDGVLHKATADDLTDSHTHTKLDGIEASADVTRTANVTAAGALMDSEVTNLAAVKAFDPADYAPSSITSITVSSIAPSSPNVNDLWLEI